MKKIILSILLGINGLVFSADIPEFNENDRLIVNVENDNVDDLVYISENDTEAVLLLEKCLIVLGVFLWMATFIKNLETSH